MEYLALIAPAYALLWVIAKLTPTEKDDDIMRKVGKIINCIFPKTYNKDKEDG